MICKIIRKKTKYLQRTLKKSINKIFFKKLKIYLQFRKKFYMKLKDVNINNRGKIRFKEDLYNEGTILAAVNYNNLQIKLKIFKSLKKYIIKISH